MKEGFRRAIPLGEKLFRPWKSALLTSHGETIVGLIRSLKDRPPGDRAAAAISPYDLGHVSFLPFTDIASHT
jgi:hypothetical protein